MFAARCLLLLLAASPGAPSAEAESASKPVEIHFDGPENCSGANAFFESLRSRTARVRRADGNESPIIVEVRLSRERGRVQGELRVADDGGTTDTRKVDGATCDEVVQALSLTAALALDPGALLTLPQASPDTDATGATLNSSAPELGGEKSNNQQDSDEQSPGHRDSKSDPRKPTEAVESPPPPRPVPDVELSAGAVALSVLSGSITPGIALGVRKTFAAGEGAFRPALGLSVLYARNDVLHSPPDAQVALLGAATTICPVRWSASLLTVRPCASGVGGWLSARGSQLNHVSTVHRAWLSGGLTLNLAAYLGAGLLLELDAGFSAPLIKRRFFATTPGNVVAETPTISPLVGVGLTYAL